MPDPLREKSGHPWRGKQDPLLARGARHSSHLGVPRGGAVPRVGDTQTWSPPTWERES